MIILDGIQARQSRIEALRSKRERLLRAPTLLIIQVGDAADSTLYIEQKKKLGTKVGARVFHERFPVDVTESILIDRICGANEDHAIDGIIVQLPLPAHLSYLSIINAIDPQKDVDGLTDENQRLLREGRPRYVPATARGVLSLLDYYGIELSGKRAVVMGRSRLVGGPVAHALSLRGASVSVCHSQTPDPKTITTTAEILVVAIGRPRYVDASYVGKGVVVVDVGINVDDHMRSHALQEEIPKRAIVGDVDHSSVELVASALSPVPGGVGPMTVISLLENLFDATEK